MKKSTLISISIFLFAILVLLSCSVNEEEKRLKDLLNNRCTLCHDLKSVKNKNLSEVEWREIIDDMIELGANLEKEEEEALVKYLSGKYGL